MSRVLKSTSPDETSAVHLYEMREEFEDCSRPIFFTERIAETQEGYGERTCSSVENQTDVLTETPHPSTGLDVRIPDPSTRDAGLSTRGAGPSPGAVCAAPFSDTPTPDEALLGAAIQELIRQQQLLREQTADRVRVLAVAIARKIICHVGEQRPDIVVDQVRFALEKLGPVSSLSIRVHPRDAEYLVARKAIILQSLDHIDRVTITGDHSMSLGGCVIETDREFIDASVESQLELVELAITDAMS